MLGQKVSQYMDAMHDPSNLKNDLYNKPLLKFLSTANRKIVTCSMEDSLMSVISIVNHYHIHRIFVEDDLGHPIGVLSILDLIQALMKFAQYPEC